MAPQLDPQFKIRMPAELRDEIETAAASNHRSMNAEIVARLSGEQRTLRDYFAAQALAIVPGHHIANANEKATVWARMAYAIADAMLAERSK